MYVLKQGETGTKSATVDLNNKTVVMEHTSVHPSLEKGAEYQLTWTLDFSSIPLIEVYAAAARHYVIQIRRDFKADSRPKENDWRDAVIDVEQYLPQERKTRKAKLAEQINALSDEQKAELMSLLKDES